MAKLSNEEILDKALEKARETGYWHFGFVMMVCWVKPNALEEYIRRREHFPVIFSPEFAKAVGYKLADLGAWCDEGGEPLEFIAHFV